MTTGRHTRTCTFTYRTQQCYAEFNSKKFAEGRTKNAYLGTIYNMNGREICICVIKKYKCCVRLPHDEYSCLNLEVEGSLKAKEMANQFNEEHQQFTKIDFVIPIVSTLETRVTCCIFCQTNCVLIEPYLEGSYIRYTDNNGYTVQKAYQLDLLLAFCHWTWQRSNKTIMVSDLQGVVYESGFFLTDPAVHAVNTNYGVMDCGSKGIKNVMSHHECNAICKNLGLENPFPYKGDTKKWSSVLSSKLKRTSKKKTKEETEARFQSIITDWQDNYRDSSGIRTPHVRFSYSVVWPLPN